MANIPFKSITFPGLPNKYTVPEISNDLMTAGKAADAKATGDALGALEDQFTEETDKLKADLSSKLTLTADGSDTIPDNADFNSYKTAGTYKVTNNDHAATMTNIPVKSAGKLIVLELSQTARAIQFYVLSNTTSIFTRYYRNTTTGESWSEWDSLAKFSVVKEIEDRVSAIEDDLTSKLELTANSSTTIPDNADFNSYKTAGTYKVTNDDHAATMTNIPVKSAGKLIVLELSQTARAIQIYVLSNTTYPIYTRYYQSTTSGESWSAWDRIAKFSSITAIGDRVTAIEGTLKSPKIKYESGSFENGLATERISVYIPATTGYLMYRLYHFVDTADINCNCWQIYNLYFVNDTLGGQTDLTAKGEWECALHLAGRDDFSGGHTHGDELFTSLTVLLDGVPVDVSTLTTNTDFDKLTIIRASKLYDPSDHTTEIAEHGVEYVFTKDGLTVRQSIKWLVSEELTNCFMAMFLPLKAKIDKAFFNSRYDVSNLASSASERTSTVTAIKATCTTMWDSDGGLSGTIAILHYPTGLTGGDNASISDNGGLSYNKLYYKVCGTGYTSTAGELWKSESVYALNFNT